VNLNYLSLEVVPTNNLKTMLVVDTSMYPFSGGVENLLLEVLPPSGTKWVTHRVIPFFTYTLNSSNLKINQVNDVSNLADLPDGIYELKISHKPNFTTQVHFFHFRYSTLLSDYKEQVCKLYSEQCSFNKSEFEDKKKQLMEIRFQMDAAKYEVEECHDKKKGLELYENAKQLLSRYKDSCGC
jgi:hypothetical protein